MSKKRNNKESTIYLTPKPSQSFLSIVYKAKKKNFQKNRFLRKMEIGGLSQKNEKKGVLENKQMQRKEGILIALATTIKKDPTTSIRKHFELKVHEKTVRTAIKQDLSPGLNRFDYAI